MISEIRIASLMAVQLCVAPIILVHKQKLRPVVKRDESPLSTVTDYTSASINVHVSLHSLQSEISFSFRTVPSYHENVNLNFKRSLQCPMGLLLFRLICMVKNIQIKSGGLYFEMGLTFIMF